MSDQVDQVLSYRRSMALKAQRAALPDTLDDVADVDTGWPYGDETGPPYLDNQDGIWPGNTADDISLAAFKIDKREVRCDSCHLVHRINLACEEAW